VSEPDALGLGLSESSSPNPSIDFTLPIVSFTGVFSSSLFTPSSSDADADSGSEAYLEVDFFIVRVCLYVSYI
jgi:hypothetical protein